MTEEEAEAGYRSFLAWKEEKLKPYKAALNGIAPGTFTELFETPAHLTYGSARTNNTRTPTSLCGKRGKLTIPREPN